MNNFLENIRQKPESYKRGMALGLSLLLTFFIAFGWAGQKGILGGGSSVAEIPKVKKTQTANVASAVSPAESSKQSVLSGFTEIKKTWTDFKDSISSVLVPFMTGIEVYEKK